MIQENLFTELSNQIDLLSHNLKIKYSNISWRLDYKNLNSDQMNDSNEYEINVAFKNEEKAILDLQFKIDENSNIRIEGGLTEGVSGDRNTIMTKGKTQFDTFRKYLSSSKELVYYSCCRIKSIAPIQIKDFTRASASIKSVMADIEVFFKLVLNQSSLPGTI